MSTSDLWSTPTVGGECQDFTRWWNSEGQFLQPIGDLQSEYGLDFAKKIAESVYGGLKVVISGLEKERDDARSELQAFDIEDVSLKENDLLIDKIEKLVEITVSTKDRAIKTLIEEYRENIKD